MTWWAGQRACFSWWQPCPLGQPAVSTCASMRCTLQRPRPPTPRATTGQKNSVGTLQTITGCVVPEQEPPSVVAFVFSLSDLLGYCSECALVINFYSHGSNHKRKWAGRTARENERDFVIRFAGNSHPSIWFSAKREGDGPAGLRRSLPGREAWMLSVSVLSLWPPLHDGPLTCVSLVNITMATSTAQSRD